MSVVSVNVEVLVVVGSIFVVLLPVELLRLLLALLVSTHIIVCKIATHLRRLDRNNVRYRLHG